MLDTKAKAIRAVLRTLYFYAACFHLVQRGRLRSAGICRNFGTLTKQSHQYKKGTFLYKKIQLLCLLYRSWS